MECRATIDAAVGNGVGAAIAALGFVLTLVAWADAVRLCVGAGIAAVVGRLAGARSNAPLLLGDHAGSQDWGQIAGLAGAY